MLLKSSQTIDYNKIILIVQRPTSNRVHLCWFFQIYKNKRYSEKKSTCLDINPNAFWFEQTSTVIQT